MPCDLKNRDRIISQYLLRELSETEAFEFQAHLFECDECFEEVTFKRKALRLFHESGEEILEALESESEPVSAWDRVTGEYYPRYKQLLATAAMVFVAVMLVFTIAHFRQKPADEQWNSDRSVPYPYHPADSFRSTGTIRSTSMLDTLAVRLQHEIDRSMGAYHQLDYALMLENMALLKANAAQLRGQLSVRDTAAAMVLRDYEFYYGVSRLARARTQIADLAPQYREQLLREAAGNISRALDLATAYGKADTDKEHYFLGLAYGFSSQFPRAVEALEAVADTANPVFGSRAALLNLWKDK